MTLDIRCEEHLAKAREFATRIGVLEHLEDRLAYLGTYGQDPTVCELHSDWAPFSFAFLMRREDGSLWFNGGLIYHGPVDGTYTDPLSVEINPDSKPHWSVHT